MFKVVKLKNNNYFNNGISLIVLIITIIVSLILITVSVIATTSAIDNAKITTFAKDLTVVEDATKTFYLTNNEMPISDGDLVKDLIYVRGIVPTVKQTLFDTEITVNNDNLAQFYVIELSKLKITKSNYGYKTNGDGDVYVISYPNMKVYYLNGISAKGTTYFSLTESLIKKQQISKIAENLPLTSVISSAGITATKNNGWSNTFGVKLNVEMSAGEVLKIKFCDFTETTLTTIIGTNYFEYKILDDFLTVTEAIQDRFNSTSNPLYIPYSQRFVVVTKYVGSNIIGSVKVDLSNYDITSPIIVGTNVTVNSNSDNNSINFKVEDESVYASGIKEIRYEYLTKYTDNATVCNYFEGITDFNEAYMKTKSKIATLQTDLTTTINVPKNIKTLKLAVIDKAGNISTYNQTILGNIYVGYNLDTVLNSSVKITANIYSESGINTLTVSKSSDGINFTNQTIYTLGTVTEITSKQLNFNSLTLGKIYIKLVAESSMTQVIETRIISIDLTNNVPASWTGSIDKVVDSVPIPKGFTQLAGTTKATGLVIQDIEGNQFVWVPVKDGLGINGDYPADDTTTVQYKKWCTQNVSYVGQTDDTLPSGVTDEKSQILNYGGFYVGRYEAGNTNGYAVTIKLASLLFRTNTYAVCKAAAEAMYKMDNVKSGFLTGSQYDTLMRWIQVSGNNLLDCNTWGNYSNSVAPANSSSGIVRPPGTSDYWKVNNIYDIGGNLWEWTSEKNVAASKFISRGGSFSTATTGAPPNGVSSRVLDTGVDSTFIGFRVALFIL